MEREITRWIGAVLLVMQVFYFCRGSEEEAEAEGRALNLPVADRARTRTFASSHWKSSDLDTS